ncbi:SPOR domain-containing protein [Azotobacter armeniacus]
MTSLHADEALLTYYQLSHDPFAPRTPGFKFFPAQRKQVLGQLHHLARYSRLLLVVSGPLGSGKTLLRQALVASSNKQTVLCVVVSARASAQVDGLLRQIALGFGLERADEQSILEQVEQLAATGQEVYLLVDDAELLEAAALDALLALAAGTTMGRPHVFLFGEPGLVTRLQSLADGEERFHVLRLNPYALKDTHEYLAQRLEGAGGDVGLFSDEQVEAIHRDSGGWPGEINRLARELLYEEMMQSGYEEDGEDAPGLVLPKKHLLALAVVALTVATAWFMRGESEGEAPIVALQPHSEEPNILAVEPAGTASSRSVAGEAQPVLREPLALAVGEADAEDIGIAGSVAVQAATSSAALAPVVQAPVEPPKPEARAPAAVRPAPAPQPRPASQSQAAVKPAAMPAPQVTARPASTPATAVPGPQAVAKPALAAVAPAPRPAATQAGAPAGGDWYRAQAASRYALQVLGTRSESSAQSFVRAQGAGYRYFRKLHQGQPLFVVTYGSFASRAEAQAAIKSLPASVQAGKPWPRTFASIQQEARVR